jgi:glucokinase
VTTAVCVDLGGTRIKAGLVEDGAVIRRADPRPTPTPWPATARAVDEVLAELARDAAVDGVGLAVPGVVEGGRVTDLPDKLAGILEVDLAAWLSGRAGSASTVIVNDAVAAGVGESRDGAAAGASRSVVVTLGTGVGVAVTEQGRILGAGPRGGGILAGQVPAGDRGSIEESCRAATLVDRAGSRWDTAAEVLAAAPTDPAAEAAVAGHQRALADSLAALGHAYAPDVIVVGGGLALDGALLAGLEEMVAQRLRFGLRLQVVAAALGDDAALVGLGRLIEDGP